jgi:hypothetical protein
MEASTESVSHALHPEMFEIRIEVLDFDEI